LSFTIDDLRLTIFAALAQQKRRPAQNGEVEGANPSRGTNCAHVVQRRDGALKTREVSVQIRPWAPPRVAQRRGVPLKTERLQVRVLPRGPLWNVNRSSEPGLFAKQCAPRKGSVAQAHGIPPLFYP